MRRSEIKEKFDEIVDFAEIEKFIDTPVKYYSSGMYVRLAFAVASSLEPEILIVDEVLAVGDSRFQEKCLGKMKDVADNGRTVLFVSHNMGTISKLCESCILLNDGKVEEIGPTASVVDKYYNFNKTNIYSKNQAKTDLFFKKVFTIDKHGKPKKNFAHKEEINLRLVISVNKFLASQNIWVCFLKQDKTKVFSIGKNLKELYHQDSDEVTVDFIIEGGLIAPMEYSFLVMFNNGKGTAFYDIQDDICPIKVFDDGTDLSFAEGMDYGCIIVKDNWKLVDNETNS